MGNRIYIKYEPNQDPVETLEAAMREHGEHEAFVILPAKLWNRWKADKAINSNAVNKPEQMSLFN